MRDSSSFMKAMKAGKTDFSSELYLCNNQQRVVQIESGMAEDMKVAGVLDV